METGTEAYIRYDPAKETAWVHAILETLKSAKRNYAKVASKQLVTMLLIVIAKTDIMPAVSEVQTCYAGVGLMNMMGNKGGVAIRFRYHDSYLCFVTSHLAAFLDKTEKRNQDFTEISKRLFFPNQLDPITDYVNYSWNNGGDEGVAFLDSNGVIRPWSKEVSIFHADHLIWVGDLNYRINLTEPEIKARVQRGELDLLLEYDQLSIERQAGRTFPMFDEGKINFLPTYKYDPGTNQYDTSEKRRAPSWTDRILWKKMTVDDSADDNEKPTSKLKLLDYNNCMEMMVSDHKPVRALMQAKIRKINEKKQKATREELIRQLKETQDNLTKGQISTSFVDFGDVQFLEYKEKKIVLENTGQVLAPFCFISKMDQDNVCPPWLQIQPLSGVIGPGEKVVIQFELMIDPTFSPPFNQGQEKIDDILVLRLVNGKDFFIVISGNYIPTCFGMPLDKLAQMTVPVNQVSLGAVTAKEQPASPAQVRPQQASLPKELWRVLNFLWNKNMLCITSLFLKHGDPVISKYIRKCLDTGEQFDNSVLLGGSIDNDEDESNDDTSTSNDNAHKEAIGANSMIDVLIAFLECLPEPVIPSDLYTQALDAADMVEVMSLLRENLPAIHFNVVLYIIDFLRDAIRYAPSESRDERRRFIVEKFTVLLRPPIGFKERNPASAQLKRIDFIRKLLKSS
ncbi:Endonuclease/exonuclease/phosphatase [Radiomyces spectabilis]|uniref:Endonuclease/exonuclease/phosphatase n=1 Tax=Radiomyces spectabilis TaxID=64574 RepID=UPI00221E988B|nr:Endonuclease/exonuclease/phosphatase [Radiomyces spectabilis]KAI8381059.1 Endonuclease/exonuclease/phosphatase [Radiomyces spectabilis]